MDALHPLAHTEMKWDPDALSFRCRLLWNDNRNSLSQILHLFLISKPTHVKDSTVCLMLHPNLLGMSFSPDVLL